jgi:hypothetical protein
MKKFIFVFVVLIGLSGCVSVSQPLMLDKDFPSREKYEILGEIGCGKTRFAVLGLVFWGGIQYLDLRDEAARKFGYVDDVVSVSVDTKIFTVLGIVVREDITMRGIAIRYIDPPPKPAATTEAE